MMGLSADVSHLHQKVAQMQLSLEAKQAQAAQMQLSLEAGQAQATQMQLPLEAATSSAKTGKS